MGQVDARNHDQVRPGQPSVSLCVLCVLRVSVVNKARTTLTTETQKTQRTRREKPTLWLRPWFLTFAVVAVAMLSLSLTARASSTFEEYEGRLITAIEITFEGSPAEPAAQAEFLSIIRLAPNTEFSAVNIRNALQFLFDSERVANARVEVFDAGPGERGPIRLRFVIQRQVQIG